MMNRHESLNYKLLYLEHPMKSTFIFFFLTFSVIACRSQSQDSNIVLINVGKSGRAEIAEQITIINALSPKVIALDLTFDVSRRDNADAKLVNALWDCKNLVMATLIIEAGGMTFIASANQPEFMSPDQRTGFVNAIQENDKRRTLKKFMVWQRETIVDATIGEPRVEYHFAARTAMLYDSIAAARFIGSHPQITNIDYKNGTRKFIKYSADDVLNNALKKVDIQGKIVIMCSLGPGNEDKFYTPLNKDQRRPDMYGGECIGNIVCQILEDGSIE
jgi:CHASE2 domain-containing sensor protein